MAMPPPTTKGKKPGVMVAIGIPKSAPPTTAGPPEGIDHAEAHDQGPGSDGKATREKALVIPSDHHCKDCSNWDGSSGDCEKVEGPFDPEDGCLRYFNHADPEDENEGGEAGEGGDQEPDNSDPNEAAEGE